MMTVFAWIGMACVVVLLILVAAALIVWPEFTRKETRR